MATWSLYIVRCKDGSLYTGIATDAARRFEEHRTDPQKGAKYLRGRGPLELLLVKSIGSRSLASKVERRVKRLPKSEKESLLKNNRLDDIIQSLKT
jgi:putative endonuclease